MRRFQRDPGGFVRDIVVLVAVCGLLAFALWAGNAWAGLETWDMLGLPGVICLPIIVLAILLWWWLGEEDS